MSVVRREQVDVVAGDEMRVVDLEVD